MKALPGNKLQRVAEGARARSAGQSARLAEYEQARLGIQARLSHQAPEDEYTGIIFRGLKRAGFDVKVPCLRAYGQYRQLKRKLTINGSKCLIKLCQKGFYPDQDKPSIGYGVFHIYPKTLAKNDFLIFVLAIGELPERYFVVKTVALVAAFQPLNRKPFSVYIPLKYSARQHPAKIDWAKHEDDWAKLRQDK